MNALDRAADLSSFVVAFTWLAMGVVTTIWLLSHLWRAVRRMKAKAR